MYISVNIYMCVHVYTQIWLTLEQWRFTGTDPMPPLHSALENLNTTFDSPQI